MNLFQRYVQVPDKYAKSEKFLLVPASVKVLTSPATK
jgi:hypothetical protein